MDKIFKSKLTRTILTKVLPVVLIVLVITVFVIIGLRNPKSTIVAVNDSIITKQNSIELSMIAEYEELEYTINDPFVKLDPYGISPLTAVIIFDSTSAYSVDVVISGKAVEGDIMFSTAEETRHIIPIYGLYADYSNTVKLTMNGITSNVSIQTNELDSRVVLSDSMVVTDEYDTDDFIFVTPALGGLSAAYDYTGEVRWYLTISITFDLKRLENGNLLVGTDRLIATPYYSTGVYEFDLIGKIYHEYQLEGGYHHDAIELPSGNLLIASSGFDGTVEDQLYEIDRETGTIVKNVDLKADNLLGSYMTNGKMQNWSVSDWFHNNSVWYDDTNDLVIMSGRHQDAVVAINYTTLELEWILGNPEGWDSTLVAEYFFVPETDDFEWQYAQHSATVTPEGYLFIFDNGNNKSKVEGTYVTDPSDYYSRGVMYDIDTVNMTISQVYEYGKEQGQDFYSPYISNVEYFAENDYLIHSGGHGVLDGVTANFPVTMVTGEHVISAESITVEVLNDVEIMKLVLPSNFYRAEKLKLYTSEITYKLGEGSVIGSLGETIEYEYSIESKFTLFNKVPEEYNLDLVNEYDRLLVNGVFSTDDEVFLVLDNGNDSDLIIYEIPTKPTKFAQVCINAFDPTDPSLTFYVNKGSLEGKYDISIVINEHKYETHEYVNFG